MLSGALGRPMPPLVLSQDEVQQLQSIASSRSLPHALVQHAQIVLAFGAGDTNPSIAKRMGLTAMTVGKWRKQYRELGLEGLHDELRPGRPRTYEDDAVAEGINRALQTKPSDGTPMVWALPRGCCRHRQNHRSPLATDLLNAASPAEAPQALHRPVLCRKRSATALACA